MATNTGSNPPAISKDSNKVSPGPGTAALSNIVVARGQQKGGGQKSMKIVYKQVLDPSEKSLKA